MITLLATMTLPLELMAAALLYMLPLQHRRHFALRLLPSMAAGLLLFTGLLWLTAPFAQQDISLVYRLLYALDRNIACKGLS